MNEKGLKDFGAHIQKLINKNNLSEEETYLMFREILKNEQPDLQQGAFLAALVSKRETIEEIAGAWKAIVEFDTVEITEDMPKPLFENSGTGMDSLKTFNVSSAAAIVAASCGVNMARHGARALTSFCGTVDILESVGIDVECDVSLVEKSICETGIGLFNGMSPKIHPSALGRILSQIRFGSTLNIAASLANPAKPTHGLRGVYSKEMVTKTASVMPHVGYSRGMIVHGEDKDLSGGMDEISITGKTTIHEFNGRHSKIWDINPEDVGLQKANFTDIATTGNLDQESVRFIKVIAGKEHKACIDFTAINAGAIIYIAGKAPDIASGINMSKNAIADGSSINKLKSWIEVQNTDPQSGLNKFEAKLEEANIK
ncbi:anthranilate phosphoribosyltransferase [bacterium B17]|nr:anthranilate phosphoribosyltransferase [bacterium B17]